MEHFLAVRHRCLHQRKFILSQCKLEIHVVSFSGDEARSFLFTDEVSAPERQCKYIKKGEPGHDPVYKLRPFLALLIAHFQSSYTLNRDVSAYESMICFKGQLGFVQYMPKKPIKWGMKAFVMSDAETGYMYNWHLYTGKLYMYIV